MVSDDILPQEGETMEQGEVVCLNGEGKFEKCQTPYDGKITGVLFPDNLKENTFKPVISGKTQIKVSTENGEIKIGDFLTSSFQPGVAMKATEPGMVIGMALEPFRISTGQAPSTNDQSTNDQNGIESPEENSVESPEEISEENPTENTEEIQIGKTMVFVNPHWSLGSLADDGSLAATNNESNQSTETEEQPTILSQFTLTIKNALEKLGLFIENGTANVKKLIAQVAQIDKLEMKDQITGEIYCTWLENGEWVKVKSSCEDLASGQTPMTNGQSNPNPEEQSIKEQPSTEQPPDETPPAEEPPTEDACDVTHLNLCTTQTECETVAGFWQNEGCSTEEPPAEEPSTEEEPGDGEQKEEQPTEEQSDEEQPDEITEEGSAAEEQPAEEAVPSSDEQVTENSNLPAEEPPSQ
jgi:hypothetical protein